VISLVIAAILLQATPPAPAPAAAGTAPVAKAAAPRAKRADLGRSYLLLERALDGRELTPERRAEFNRRVDRVAGLFFANRFADAMRLIAEVVAEIEGLDAEATRSFVAANLHRAIVDPPVCLATATEPPRLRLESLADGMSLPPGATLLFRPPAGEPTVVEIGAMPMVVHCRWLGRHEIEIVAGEGVPPVPAGSFQVVARDPEGVAGELVTRLDAVKGAHPQDVAAIRSRLAILTDAPSAAKSVEFLSDQAELAAACERDVAALEAGTSPFVGRRDEHWRTVSADAVPIPVRVIAPPGDRLPLVIALHGAGGDESMFFSGYGNGLLQRLAVERGFVAVTPFTPTFMASPLFLDAIVEEMARCHSIDRGRILLLGHSLGAGATGSITALRPAVPAAIACLAGPTPVPAKPLAAGEWPPILACVAELDGVIPAVSIRRGIEAGRTRGADITERPYPDEGHTLVVGTCLPEVIDFLLRAPPRATASAGAAPPAPPTAP
jgi:predicted esterase